jgi:hypothetical protein
MGIPKDCWKTYSPTPTKTLSMRNCGIVNSLAQWFLEIFLLKTGKNGYPLSWTHLILGAMLL